MSINRFACWSSAWIATAIVAVGCGADAPDAARNARNARDDQVRALTINAIVVPYAVVLRADLMIWPPPPELDPILDQSLTAARTASVQLREQPASTGVRSSYDELRASFDVAIEQLLAIRAAIAADDVAAFTAAVREYAEAADSMNAQLRRVEQPPMFVLPVLGSPPQH